MVRRFWRLKAKSIGDKISQYIESELHYWEEQALMLKEHFDEYERENCLHYP